MWLRKLFPLCKEQALIVNRSLSVRQFSNKSPDYSISSIFSSLKNRFNVSKKTSNDDEGLFIGIDLGATKSCVAVMEGDVPKVLENKEIPRKTPSYVTVTDNGKPIVGNQSKYQPLINPEYTMFSTRRLFEEWLDQSEYKIYKHQVPFNPVDAVFKNWAVKDDGTAIDTSEETVAYILGKLKDSAESYLKTSVHGAVISIPSYSIDGRIIQTTTGPVFNASDTPLITGFIQRAARRVGFNSVYTECVSESFASSIASSWAYNKELGKEIVICNFSGGKFGFINILRDGTTPNDFLFRSTYEQYLGGDAFDYALMNLFNEFFIEWTGIDLCNDVTAMSKLREAAVDTKIQLSQATEVNIDIPELAVNSCGRCQDFTLTITREEFEILCHDYFEEIISFCHDSVKRTVVDKKLISEVFLVGGMTKIPKFRKMAEEFFELTPNYSLDPDVAAAIGDALRYPHIKTVNNMRKSRI